MCYCYDMKPDETKNSTMAADVSVPAGQNITRCPSHASSFAKIPDGRKQPIRGLWERNGQYYAQLIIENTISSIKKLKRVHVHRFIEGLLKEDLTPRTVNIYVIVFRAVMKHALSEGLIYASYPQ